MNNWYNYLKKSFEITGDDFSKIKTTLSPQELHRVFDDGYGVSLGSPFTAWGEKYVYFPVVYDGNEWVGYVRRNPCEEASRHWGGE